MDKSANRCEDCPLTPALLRLLKACLDLQTTDARLLAAHLYLSPATVRTEFQRILTALGVHGRYAALKMAEDCGWLKTGGAKLRPSEKCMHLQYDGWGFY